MLSNYFMTSVWQISWLQTFKYASTNVWRQTCVNNEKENIVPVTNFMKMRNIYENTNYYLKHSFHTLNSTCLKNGQWWLKANLSDVLAF